MSLTDNDLAVKKFYYSQLLPVAKELQGQGKTFFDKSFDSSCNSYYIKRKKTTMEPEDFESVDCPDIEAMEQALIKMWTESGDSALIQLVPEMAALAQKLYLKEDQDEEVSPFVYVMF
jgi:hypothetical protein